MSGEEVKKRDLFKEKNTKSTIIREVKTREAGIT